MVITGHQSSESTYVAYKDISELFQNDLKECARQNKQQERGEALFDQKQGSVAVTDMVPRYNTLVYNSMHENT